MKRMIYAFLLFGMFSCKKDNAIKNIKEDIAGNWELRASISFGSTQNFSAGNGNIFIFGQNDNYQRKAHDTLVMSGHYTIKKQKDCYERETDYALYISETSSGGYQYIEVRNDTLIFSTPNCLSDGVITYYKRL
jgi:hypothetical protein